MNYSSIRKINIHLYTEEEAFVVENVVKTAVRAVMDTIHRISDAKLHEYQRMVVERDKEIRRLEVKLEQTENKLNALHVRASPCDSLSGKDCGYIHNSCYGRATGENEGINEQDVKTEFPSPGTRTPPSDSAECGDGVSAAASLQLELEEQISRSSEGTTDSVSPASRVSGPLVKEEHLPVETVFITWEMCEPRLGGRQEGKQGHGCRGQNPMKKRRLTNAERQKRYRERCRATPEGLRAYKERERLSYMRKRVLISEMSEETKRQKSAAWRAAARRARDHKLVQTDLPQPGHAAQLDPSKSWPFPQHTDTPKYTPRCPRGRSRTNSGGGRLHSWCPTYSSST
ncbi:uncharacterized protein LOC139917899 isoform X2 [Centroberyx gerrardi]